jgi:hypothetical protein
VRRSAFLFAMLFVLSCVVPAFAADVVVRAGLETEDALLGESVVYRIVVEGVDVAEGPAVEEFGFDFDVQFLGGQPERQRSSVWVNGRRVDSASLSYTLFYSLRPRRAGTLSVPELTVRADKRDFKTPARSMRVIGPSASTRARLLLSFSPRRVYVEQPVELVLKIVMQRAQLPDAWYEGDPWFPGRPPELRVPWFEELDGFLAGDARGFMRSILATGNESGMRINGIASQGLLGDSRALRFKLPRGSEIQDGRGVHVYTLRKTLIPLSAGAHEIPISTLTGDLVVTLERARGQLQAGETDTVFIAHEPATLEVLPVPLQGRPPTYAHAVGRYSVEAEVTPKRVKVGDPMNVAFRSPRATRLIRRMVFAYSRSSFARRWRASRRSPRSSSRRSTRSPRAFSLSAPVQ